MPKIVFHLPLAPIAFDGPDAASFLHNQLSTDVLGMGVGAAGWTTYNSPKGRVLASPLLWRRAQDSFVAFVAPDLADALRKRLSMFVLRSKVAVAAPEMPLAGVVGEGAGQALAGVAEAVALPDGRELALADPGTLAKQLGAQFVEAPHWEWLGVRAGVAQVTRDTQDLFVPQSLNFDLVGAVNFRKGCYPGQEIVARMQYLGRLKERLFAFHVDGPPPAPGTRLGGLVLDVPAGTVVNAAPSPDGGSDLVAVVPWDAAHAGGLRVEGRDLSPLPLPYAVPEPVAPTRVKL